LFTKHRIGITRRNCGMKDKELLIEKIEQERKKLDHVVLLGLNRNEVLIQSRKLDHLIEEYYK
jgi:hypothetical protein